MSNPIRSDAFRPLALAGEDRGLHPESLNM